MQVNSLPIPELSENLPYNAPAMPRKLTKTRPLQGKHLADLRKAAGLSQYELARIVGVPQANIAFWERSEKPPRSDVLPKMAKALAVKVEDILNPHSVPDNSASNGRMGGKLREAVDEAGRLPRRQQEKVAEFVTAFVRHY